MQDNCVIVTKVEFKFLRNGCHALNKIIYYPNLLKKKSPWFFKTKTLEMKRDLKYAFFLKRILSLYLNYSSECHEQMR